MTSVTAAQQALDLFQRRPATGDRIDWLANQLLALAAESPLLPLRVAIANDGEPTLECSDPVQSFSSSDPGLLRVFRTLLARLAKMAEEENGTAFNPYGGTLYFDRVGPHGPVRLSVEFGNTTTVQSLSLSK